MPPISEVHSLRKFLELRPQGLYCPAGDFFVDPTRPVARALITHGHADHARAGHANVLATAATLEIMASRYGEQYCKHPQAVKFGETMRIGDAHVRFHPAGHILGSAQIAIEPATASSTAGRIVVSGDYKRGVDRTCEPFEPIACDIFISEATFGLPVFRHPDTSQEIKKLFSSLELFPDRAHLVGCYSLGKAQRLASLIHQSGYVRPIYLHGAMINLMAIYERHGVAFGPLTPVTPENKTDLAGEIILCPPSSISAAWSRGIPDPIACFASGWMRIRAHARRRGVELPLILSDHADWDELTTTIRETGCEEVWLTHGEADALVHWARLHQLRAQPLNMIGYGEDEETETAPIGAERRT